MASEVSSTTGETTSREMAAQTAKAPRGQSEGAPPHQYNYLRLLPFLIAHGLIFFVFLTGVTWVDFLVLGILYAVRMFGVTAGYHRLFSHRTFETSRPVAFMLAFLAQTSSQKGALWWAANHRHHHLHSDDPKDVHSPKQHGFWHAHVGWLYSTTDETDLRRIRDWAKYPELVWLNRNWLVPPLVLGVVITLCFGWSGLIVGFFGSTVLLWHGTFSINSLSHVWGYRRFATKDTSRNNPILALITLGEGWHNNHHRFMNSVRQGFKWWEYDFTYYVLKVMGWCRLVWNLKEPPRSLLRG